VRRSRLHAIGAFDETLTIGHDWDCWLRLILDGAQAGFVDQPYYDYALHSGTLTASRVSSLWDRVRLLEKAAGNPALEPHERPVLARSIRRQRAKAVLADTQATLFGSGSRSRLHKLVTMPGIGVRTRMLVALALTAPPLARRILPQDQPPDTRFTTGGR
jgi:hypothetical protein